VDDQGQKGTTDDVTRCSNISCFTGLVYMQFDPRFSFEPCCLPQTQHVHGQQHETEDDAVSGAYTAARFEA
jgi:hypothetical protein